MRSRGDGAHGCEQGEPHAPTRRAARSRELREDRFHFRLPNRSCAGKKEAPIETFGVQRAAVRKAAGGSCLAGGEFDNSLLNGFEIIGAEMWKFFNDFAYTHDVEIIYPTAPRESAKSFKPTSKSKRETRRESVADQSSCEQLVALPSSSEVPRILIRPLDGAVVRKLRAVPATTLLDFLRTMPDVDDRIFRRPKRKPRKFAL